MNHKFQRLVQEGDIDKVRTMFIESLNKRDSMKFYSENGDKKYTDCFSMPGASKAALIKLFMSIDKELSKQRNEIEENKAWTIFTMKVDSDGHMKAIYEYDDHSEDMVAYESAWEKKYLI